MDNIESLKKAVGANPGAPEFAELARLLSEKDETRAEAREICFRGLNANPSNAQGRLVLAKLFYLDGLGEFCVRELIELRKYSEAKAIDKLLAAFGDFAVPFFPGKQLLQKSLAVPQASEIESGKAALPAESSVKTNEQVVAEIDLDFTEAMEEIEKQH